MKRGLDFLMALALLILLGIPLLVVGGILLLLDGRPVLFAQERMGRNGRKFRILKFRTMAVAQAPSPEITAGERDHRITTTGRFLRRRRLDEFPQLVNVLVGHMSLVGPRPEVPRYVDLEDPRWTVVLSVRPGITGPDSLAFRNEGIELAAADDADRHYREVILPEKLKVQMQYAKERTVLGDVRLLFRTLGVLRG